MMEFIKTNISSIVAACIIISGLLYLYFSDKRDLAKKIILSLVVQAEKHLGSGTGKLKYAFVVEKAYVVLPPIIRFFLSKEELDQMIEDAVEYLKRYLADGKNLLGYGEDAGA